MTTFTHTVPAAFGNTFFSQEVKNTRDEWALELPSLGFFQTAALLRFLLDLEDVIRFSFH